MALEVRFTCNICQHQSDLTFAEKPQEDIRCGNCQAKFIGDSLAALSNGNTLMTGKTMTPKGEELEQRLKKWLDENGIDLVEKLKS